MSKKGSGKDSLPVSNNKEVRTSDEDVIILDVGDSSPDDLLPDISVTNKKTPSHHQHHITNCRPSASTGVRTVAERPASMDAAVHGPRKCGPLASHKGDLVSHKTGGVAKPANQSRTGAYQKHHMTLSTPPTGKNKPPQKGTLLSPTRTPGAPGSSLPERNVQLADRSDSARKVGKARALHTPTMDSQHSGRFLDCMDLFTPSPAGERHKQPSITPTAGERHKQPSITPTAGERHKQPNITPRAGHGIEMSGKRHKIFASAGTLVRAKIGEKRPRKHSNEFERGSKVPPGSGKTARLNPGVGSSVPTANKEKSLQTGLKALSPTAVTERPCSLGKHGSQSARGGAQSTTRGALDKSMPPAGSVASKPVSQVPRSPQPFAKTAPKLSQTALPQTKKVRKPSLSPTTSKTPLSPPSVLPRRSSAPKIITLQHFQQNDSNGSSLNKDSETETSSSIFDFNENDLFEVLDSVESESICSAYNSDGKSVGVNKPTSESSKLVTSHTCKSPSDSRVHDFTQSFVKRKRKKLQVARKSTTLNGERLYKHPLRGRGRIPMQRYCTISLPRLQNSIVQKARKDYAKYKQSKKQASAITAQAGLLKSTKKRENKLRNSSSTTAAKRIKLSSDFPASQPAAVDLNTSPPVQPASLPQTAQSNTSLQIPQTEQSQEKGSLKPKQKDATASKKAVQVACRPQAPEPVMQTQAEKHSLGEKNNPLKKPVNRSLSPTGMLVPKPSPALSPQKSSRPLPLILQRPSLSSKVSGGGLTNSVSSLSSPPDLSGEAPSVEGKKEFPRFVLGVPLTKSQKIGTTSEPVTPMFKKSLSLKHSKPATNRSASEQPPDQPSGEPDSPIRFPSQPLSVEATVLDRSVQKGDKTVACVPASKPQHPPASKPQHPHVSDQSSSAEGPLVESEAQVNGSIADKDEHVTIMIQEAGRNSVAAGEVEPMASTLHSVQGDHRYTVGTQPVEPETSTKEKDGSGKLSQRDEAYDLRLLETIAKFAPETSDTTANKNRELSSSDVEVGITRSSGAEVEKCPALTVKVPVSQLHRIPGTSPVVITRPLGMFRDASVQAERGMIIDKDVLDNYLVVKLSEAMFDMKAQLQMMEAQVASITKQKESLERTLQAKTQYVRDMTTTGLKPAMVDKGTLTDGTPISPEQIHPRTSSESSSQTKPKPKSRKSVQTQERGFQTRPKVSTVACQTDGFLRSVPPRLQVRSHPVCLYSYPESELQLYIEEGKKSVVHPSDTLDSRKEPTSLVGAGYNKWFRSVLADGECSRSMGVSPKVRFLKAIKNSSKTQSCANCSAGSTQACATTCNCSNVEASTDNHEATSKVCFPPPLHATSSKLIELYLKLKALPKEPVQERHMESVLEAVHHLLTHLPIEIKSPTLSTSVKPAARTSPQSPAVSTGPSSAVESPTASDPSTPPSGEPTTSSPPSTPGAASWTMGAKMQGLVDVLQELDDQGKKVFPKYFKAELAQLQKKTKNTLAFLTVGLRHETFSHDKSGCIVASDIQLRPWRNQELQVNPFFHRLFLDVGIRGLLHKMKDLMKQNRKGRRLGKESSEEDSDLELLCSPPPSSEQRTRAQATSGSSRARKRKAVTVNGKKFKKTSTSKRERIRQLVLEKQVRADARNITIPAPKPTSRESHPTSSTPPTDRRDLVPGAYTSTSKVSRTSSSEVARTSMSAIPLAVTPLPVTTSSPTSPSPTRLSPCNKLITKKSFRLRLQSSVTPSHQPLDVSSESRFTVASGTTATDSRTIASIPCKTGGNVSSQRTLGHYMQRIAQRSAQPVSTASQSSQALGSMLAPSTSSTAKALPSAPCPTNTAAPSVSTAVASAVATHSTESSSLPRVTLFNALETLACVLQRVKMSPGEKETLKKLIARALSLSRSTYAIDLHMAQLLVNQITQQLHMRAPSTRFSGGSSVLVQQISPFMTYAYPTRSTFSASPNIVTPLTLPMTMHTPPISVALSVCANSTLQTPTDSEAEADSVTASVQACANAAVEPSVDAVECANADVESSVDAVECANAAVESSVAEHVTVSVQESANAAVESSVAASVTPSVQECANADVESSVAEHVTASVQECANAAVEYSIAEHVTVSVQESANAAVESSVAVPVTASVQECTNADVESSVAEHVTASVQECANAAVESSVAASVTPSVQECANADVESSVAEHVTASVQECTNADVESSVAASVTPSVQECANADVESSVAEHVTASVQECANAAVESSVPSSQPFAQQTPAPAPNTTLPFPRLRIIMVSPTPRILPVPPIRLVAKPAEPLHKVVVATPAVPLHEVVKKKHKQYIIRLVVTSGHVEPNATVQTTMDKQGPTTTTNATVQTTMDKQGPTTTTSTTPKATLSTTTSTTAACGDVRMSPGVATAAVLATAQIQNQVSGEPNQNHVSTEPTMPDQQKHVSTEPNKIQQPVSPLPATVASTTTANTSKQVTQSQSAEPPSSKEASSPSTMNKAAWQGIAGVCDDVIIHKFSSGGKDTREDEEAQEVHSTDMSMSNATSSAEKVEMMPRYCAASASSAAKSTITSMVSAPSVSLVPATNTIGIDTETRSSCASRVSNAAVVTPIPSAGGLQSSSLRSVVSSAKPIATTTSIPSSITNSSSIGGVPVTAASVPVTTATVGSSGKNAAISASSIIRVLKEITPLLSYPSCPAATVPIVTTSAPSTPTANTVHVPSTTSTAITSSCTTSTANTIVPAASSAAAPIAPKSSTAAISTVSTDATPVASSLSAAPGTSTTNTKATIPCLSPTTATNTHAASKLATLFSAPLTTNTKATIPSKTTTVHAENVTPLAASAPSSSNTTPIATPISTSAQMCNSSVSTATFFASCTRNDLIDSMATSTTTTQTGNPAVLSSRGQPGPIQAPIKPHGTIVNSLTSLPLSVPPSVVHVPSVSSLYHFSQRDLPVVKLQASKVVTGLIIKWTFSPEHLSWQNFVKRYDLYAFVSNRISNIPDVSLWGKVGEIKPLALPMAVTLTNFAVGQRYAFAVRVSYVGGVTSRYSNPCTIEL